MTSNAFTASTCTATATAATDAATPDAALHLEIHFKVLRLLQDKPDLSQRQMAKALGLSLGKTNFCVQALLQKGWLKLQNFSGNSNKQAYAYLLTPEGIASKAQLTTRFLQRKQQEYMLLQAEIETLQKEVNAMLINQPLAPVN